MLIKDFRRCFPPLFSQWPTKQAELPLFYAQGCRHGTWGRGSCRVWWGLLTRARHLACAWQTIPWGPLGFQGVFSRPLWGKVRTSTFFSLKIRLPCRFSFVCAKRIKTNFFKILKTLELCPDLLIWYVENITQRGEDSRLRTQSLPPATAHCSELWHQHFCSQTETLPSRY